MATKIMRDENGESRGYGFVNFDTFEASDSALGKMNGQFLDGQPIEISYAYKKDTAKDRHGSMAERILAKNRPAPPTNPPP